MPHKIIFERKKIPQDWSTSKRCAIERYLCRAYKNSPLMASVFGYDKDGNYEFWIYTYAKKLPPHVRHRNIDQAKKLARNARGQKGKSR